jgi:hypothetical protein
MNPIKLDSKKNNFEISTPVIFNKLLKKSSIKKLDYISSDTGRIRHFPPAAQEWYNSVYNYDTRYIKNLPVSDKTLMKLLKSYFNMYIDERTVKSKSLDMLLRRRSAKKIFIGKGELKHTNSKVIITFYVHNTEKLSLKREYINLYKSLYSPKKRCVILYKGEKAITYLNRPLERYITIGKNGEIAKDIMGNDLIKYNRPFTMEEFLGSTVPSCKTKLRNYRTEVPIEEQLTYSEMYYSIVSSFVYNLTTYIKVLIKYYEYLTNLVKIKILNDDEKLSIFLNKAGSFYAYNYPNFDSYKNIAEKKYLENLHRLRYLLKFNSVKFENPFIGKFKNMVEKLYLKKVEFNIVNLKKMHLNSDILTQAIVLKLKDRQNMFSRVLRSSLNRVNLPNVSRLGEKYSHSNKNEYLINKIRNTYIHDMFKDTTDIDSLNKLLLNYFPSADKLELETNLPKNKSNDSLRNYVFKHLKHIKLGGVRIEAKGRLSRRFTAARSVFKLSWKGGLKNVDSSFKGLSAVMLRGDTKSNVEYSVLNSKRRIGAFGIKGWVSSK